MNLNPYALEWEKLKTEVHFPVAVVLYDMEMQSASVPLI